MSDLSDSDDSLFRADDGADIGTFLSGLHGVGKLV